MELISPSRQVAFRTIVARIQAWLNNDTAMRYMLAVILVLGALLRWSNINWDLGTHVHPDENFLTMVASAMQMPASLKEFFDSTQSPMNPYNRGFGLFVYGTLPIFIVRVGAELANHLNQSLKFFTFAPGAPVDLTGYGGIYLVGRALSGFFDAGSIWLAFVLGRRLYSKRVGLLAAVFYAFSAFPLQQSHFFTVDTFSTFFALLTIYLAVRVAQGGITPQISGGWVTYFVLGVSLGASVACRINLAPLGGIAFLAACVRAWDDWHHLSVEQRKSRAWFLTFVQAVLFRLLIMMLTAVVTFRITQPYAFGGTSLSDFSLAPRWLDNMREISRTMKLDVEMPPTHQWANRTPFVFPFVNMVVWGMGVPLGLIAWSGWLIAVWQTLRALTLSVSDRGLVRSHLLPVTWIGGMFLWQGLQAVQSMRYLLPMYPFLAIMAAWLLWWLVERARERISESANQRIGESQITNHKLRIAIRTFAHSLSFWPWHRLAYGLLAAVTIFTILWGWGFLAIYRRPLTRVTASRWMYENIPPGSRIGVENWDEALPLNVDDKNGYGGFGFMGLSSGEGGTMPMMWEDVPAKREGIYQWLNEADYIVISSNRRWASAPRMPLRFPMTIEYYRLIFEEKLGFELVLHVKSFPTIFGIEFNDNWAEEAFSVYDHPQVFIFKKTLEYSEALARSYLDKIDLEQVIPMTTKQVSQAPTALYLTEDQAATQRAGGTWSDIFDLDGPLNRLPALAVAAWLGLLLLLGIVAFPLTFVALRGLPDRGYGVSKMLGVLLLAWLSWLGPSFVETLHATSLLRVPYDRWWIALCLGLLIGLAAAVGWRRRGEIAAFVRDRRALLLSEEAIFLLLFALFLLIRIGNPDLWHPARGGEKPMDFAYLNAVIRSTTFPPYDPWHAGGFINYYYFGFVIVGTLIKLTGIVPWVAYNLAVPTLFALAGVAAFSVAFGLADRDPATEFPGEEPPYQGLRIGSLLAGLAGVFFVTIIGNLGNVKLLADQLAQRSALQMESTLLGLAKLLRAITGGFAVLTGKEQLSFPNDWWFWNATRTIPDTINEFPFFTFTYADLHAHMIALPLALLALAAAVALVRMADGRWQMAEPSPWCISMRELLPIGLLGLVIGALRATNTWDFPTYTLVGLAAILVLEAARRGRMAWWPAGMTAATAPLQDRLAFLFRAAVSVVWRAGIMLAVATVTFLPYTQHYATAYGGLQLWKEAKTAIPDYLTVWGFFLALGAIYLISELIAQRQTRRNGDASLDSRRDVVQGTDPLSMTAERRARPVTETASSVTLSGSAGQSAPQRDISEGSRLHNGDASLDSRRNVAHGNDPLSMTGGAQGWLWDNLPSVIVATVLLIAAGWIMGVRVWLIAAPLFVLALLLAAGRDLPPTRRLALLLLALALAITMGVEVVRLKDDIGRMNTVFKFYMQAWTLFGVSAAFGLASWLPRSLIWRPSWRRLAWGVALVLFVGAMLYPATAARAKIRDRFSAEASPRGLDGMAYMDRAQYFDNGRDLRLADDKAAILWLLTNVQGSPVILEAQIPEYRWGSRFSIYTGLPAVQGWNWHQRQQRSVVPAVVERRVQQVQELYNTNDLARARHLLDTYKVSYVIVGELERAYYTPEGLAKFGLLVDQGYLRVAYVGGSVIIYEVTGRAATAPPTAAAPAFDSPLATPALFASPGQ